MSYTIRLEEKGDCFCLFTIGEAELTAKPNQILTVNVTPIYILCSLRTWANPGTYVSL